MSDVNERFRALVAQLRHEAADPFHDSEERTYAWSRSSAAAAVLVADEIERILATAPGPTHGSELETLTECERGQMAALNWWNEDGSQSKPGEKALRCIDQRDARIAELELAMGLVVGALRGMTQEHRTATITAAVRELERILQRDSGEATGPSDAVIAIQIDRSHRSV